MEMLPSWLPAALTGGLAGAALTQLINWLVAKKSAKQSRLAHIAALKQELRLARSVIEYNHDQVLNEGKPHKGLATVPTSNAEVTLLGAIPGLPVLPETLDILRDYLRQMTYLNSLIVEERTLVPQSVSNPAVEIRLRDYMSEIKALCTEADAWRENPSEPSLRYRISQLLGQLGRIRV